jgi:uncharacterized protein (TIGR03435 family)
MWRFTVASLIAAGAIAIHAFGQPIPAHSFEAAEIKVNNSGAEKSSGDLSNGRLTLRNLPLRWLIAEAWTMHPDDVEGPSWLDDVRVDTIAKAASPQTSDAELRLMLQTLLQDRMKLVAHAEQRDKSAWVLTVWTSRQGRNDQSNLKRSAMPEKPEDADCNRSTLRDSGVRLTCQHETMAEFAHELPQYAGGYVTSTVVDKTELQGVWDFSVEWTPQSQLENNGGLTLFAALQAQLGLQLAQRKVAVPVLVVDKIERTPEAN